MLEVKGNLLEADVDVIMHQVNCKGVMGAGVARQIRQKLLSEEEYQRYVTKCHAFPATELLGTYMEHATQGFRVIDLFGEDQPTGKGLDTDYDALYQALSKAVEANKNNSIAVPGYLGCGLGGGDWETVYRILQEISEKYQAKITIYYIPDSLRMLWDDFGNVLMDPETECIEKEWHGFPSGTHREEIWHWFEETFQISVAKEFFHL